MKFYYAIAQKNAWTGEDIIRTKQSHPYSYEPFTVYGSKPSSDKTTSGVYSDRMLSQGWDKYDYCCEVVFGKSVQHFEGIPPEEIEKFLKLFYSNDKLKLLWIVEDCNQASGYPLWYFSFSTGE